MNNKKGFTLIELIMVTIILGILAAVAIPRYMSTVTKAEEAAEDAVVSAILAGLESYATEQLMADGRRSWPANPFAGVSDAVSGVQVTGYTTDDAVPDVDGEWTYQTSATKIWHQRDDNTRHFWVYTQGTSTGDNAAVGSIGARDQ